MPDSACAGSHLPFDHNRSSEALQAADGAQHAGPNLVVAVSRGATSHGKTHCTGKKAARQPNRLAKAGPYLNSAFSHQRVHCQLAAAKAGIRRITGMDQRRSHRPVAVEYCRPSAIAGFPAFPVRRTDKWYWQRGVALAMDSLGLESSALTPHSPGRGASGALNV